MSLDSPTSQAFDGRGCRFAILAARYNADLVEALVGHAVTELNAAGAPAPVIERVPGSAELPVAAAVLIEAGGFDAIIAIGVVIAGDTSHHQIIGDSTAVALQELSVRTRVPVLNGILVVNDRAQAEARAGTTINRGREFAQAALEIAHFCKKWKTTKTNPNQ